MAPSNPDIVLSNGREITFDLTRITLKDWDVMGNLDLFDPSLRVIFAPICGLTSAEMDEIGIGDWRHIFYRFVKVAREPLKEDFLANKSISA
jgi:hypothetical protein